MNEKNLSLLPNLSSVQTLYISVINSNGIKSLIPFLKATKLALSLNRLILRIPKSAAKNQITLNNDLARLMKVLNGNYLRHLRFEICEFSWISIWNTINIIISYCGLNNDDEDNDIDKINVLNELSTLEFQLYHPYTAATTASSHRHRRSKRRPKNDDTKDLIIKLEIQYRG